MIEVAEREYTSTEKADAQAKVIIQNILDHGSLDIDPRPKYEDGTPAHTKSINHVMQTFDISKGEFPLLSLRYTAIKNSIKEILWIYQDQTSDLNVLKDKYNISWWDAWDIGDRSIGDCYGRTVKNHKIIDDLLYIITKEPDSRRLIINLWQYDDFLKAHGLKPCALYSQYNIRHEEDGDYMDGFLLLRSSDYLVAGAINQMQYIALLMMIAQVTGYKVGRFSCVMVNCQIYDRHIEQAKEMLARPSIPLNPKIVLNPDIKDFYDFTINDFTIENYDKKTIESINPQFQFEKGI